MGRTRIGRLVALAIALAVWCSLPAVALAGSYGWGARTSPTADTITGVAFTSADNGWIVTDSGYVYHTLNGGSSWATATVGESTTWSGVRFADANHGWITGQNNIIVHTTDGGATWETLHTAYGAALARPFALDASRVWVPLVGAGGTVARSTDGGTSWDYGYAPMSDAFSGAAFSDAQNGWIVGYNGVVYRSYDGGATLETRTIDAFKEWFQDVSVVDSQTAIAVSSSGSSVCLWDNGSGWDYEIDSTSAGSLKAVQCVGNKGEAFAVGWASIVHTTNYGSPWTTVASPAGIGLEDLSFPDPFTGFAVGSGGTFLAYTAPRAPAAHSIEATDTSGLWITWDTSPDADTYQVRQPGGSTQSGITTNTTSVASLPLGDSEFYVRAVTANGLVSRWSTGTITIHALVPGTPVVTAPTAVVTPEATISWLPVSGAQSYDIRVNGGSVVNTTAVSATLSALAQGDNSVDVRARSYLSAGNWRTVHIIYAIPATQTLWLSRTPSALTYPATWVAVSGSTGGHATTVTVEARIPGGAWTSTGIVVRSGSGGLIAARGVRVTCNAWLRLTSKATPYWKAGLSNTVYVTYRPLVGAPSQAKSYVGHRLTTIVRVYTPRSNPGGSVVLRYYRWVSGTWKKIATVTAARSAWSSGSTRFTGSYKPGRRGSWKVTATYAGGSLYAGGSSSHRFTVY